MGSEQLEMRHLGKVLVLGVGKTGRDVALYLKGLEGTGRVSSVTVYGGAGSHEGSTTQELEASGVDVVLGTDEVEGSYDLAVASPGIPEPSDFFQSARAHASELIGEPELAWRESPYQWVAITGTNGKTTTTTLTQLMLDQGLGDAVAVGNIGTPTIEAVGERPQDRWLVAELSSFQLQTTRELHPRAAGLLNIAPDHLEWHKTMEAYAAAKEKIFQNLTPGDLAVISRDDDFCLDIRKRLQERGLRVLTLDAHEELEDDCAAFTRSGRLVVRLDGVEHELLPVSQMRIQGIHNVEDALAASSIALELGVGEDVVCDVLRSFHPLAHRIEPCGEANGVRFVNDSKATNPDSVLKALTAFQKGTIVLLLGGYDKGLDLRSFSRDVASSCKCAVCFGAVGPRMADAVEEAVVETGSDCQVVRAGGLRDAFQKALDVAGAGDTVLLSPACSSFDEFNNMAERGDLFKELAAEQVQKAEGH